MRTRHLALATLALAFAAGADPAPPTAPGTAGPSGEAGSRDVRPLDLHALYAQRSGGLALSPAVEALRGHQVRVRGYMIQMEEAIHGQFYLAARPVVQDESGGGTADVPVDALLVRVPALADQPIPWRAQPVEVVGTLEVGRVEDADGRVSTVRVILTGPSAR